MKKNLAATFQQRGGWKRLGVAALLSGSMLTLMPLAGLGSASAAEPPSGEANLNFVGADVESVIKAIGQYTNITFVIDPRVKGTINLMSEKPVSKAQAFRLLGSALRLQGYAVVMSDGYAKVVPEADAKLQVGPTKASVVRGDQIATQIYRLNYESAANLVAVLRPLISPNNTINANVGSNSLVITDYADNLKRLGKIIAALDSPGTSDFDVIPVQYAVATDIALMVNRLMESGGPSSAAAAGSNDRVSLLADPRTNSVIIRAPSVARANLAKSLIAKLDLPTQQAGNVHVVYLKNAEATKLALTLRAVVGADTSASSNSATGQPSTSSNSSSGSGLSSTQSSTGGMGAGSLQSSSGSTSNQGPLSSGGAAGFIQADAATNSLIITASEPVYRNLRSVIDQLDARRAQVYIESLIVEITASDADQLGVQWAGLSGNSGSNYRVGTITGFSSGGDNLINQLISQATPNGVPTAPSNGLNLGVFRQINGVLGLGAIAHALASQTNTNILSMPNLITLDNEEARIIVGQNVPFITGQFTTPASGGGAGVNPFQTVERKDVGLSLRVRPQISEGGTVKMAIYQETSNIQPKTTTATTGAADLITSKRSIETNVLVDDGQIVVLGGLIEDSVTDTDEKVPGLGDIPILGNLFKYRTRGRSKTNLMVFLRPTVIRSSEQSVNIAADRYDFIRNLQIEKQPEPTIIMPKMKAPVLPPLQDGRMVGGSLYNNVPADKGTVEKPLAPLQVDPAPAPAPMDRTIN